MTEALSPAVIADLLLHGGVHQYLSTYCLHALAEPDRDKAAELHALCSADVIARAGSVVPRDPAQCKVCAAPCVCDCHAEVVTRDAVVAAARRVLTVEDRDAIAEEATAKRKADVDDGWPYEPGSEPFGGGDG